MSDEMFHREGLTATRYTGAARSDSGSRERVQLYNHHGGDNRIIDLSAEQWTALGDWFDECRHPEGTEPEPASTSRRARSGGAG